ncbi:MAG TPA: PQQ-binding-like beta-propeller repeat protein [Gemmata sp.]|nr:PQQ-binding-like beta-propeller repeat protein [Gemmata sp.]
MTRVFPFLVVFATSTALIAADAPGPNDWPQWRGPDRTGVSKETGLLKTWTKDGPPKVWTVKGLGGGYGSPIVVAGKIYGLGKIGGKEYAWCLNEKDGAELWSKEFAAPGGVGYDEGPRCTPTYHTDPKLGAVIYAVGVGGDLVCLKADTGEKVWSKNFGKDFGGRMMSGWGYSESPLVDGDKLICTPGSDTAAIVALNKATGEVIWKAAIPKAGGSGYSSLIKATVGEVPMYITLLGQSGGVVAVHADTGKELWRYTKINNGTANIPTVIFRDDLVWCSTGYGAGSALLKLTADGKDKVNVKELKHYTPALQNHHGGMVLVGDYVYFGADHGQGFPACVDFKTGEIQYKLGKALGGGGGSAAIASADGMLYYRYENGQMVLLNATPDESELKVAGSFKVPEPSKAAKWAHPVIANGMLFLRDQDKLHCYNIKADKN